MGAWLVGGSVTVVPIGEFSQKWMGHIEAKGENSEADASGHDLVANLASDYVVISPI